MACLLMRICSREAARLTPTLARITRMAGRARPGANWKISVMYKSEAKELSPRENRPPSSRLQSRFTAPKRLDSSPEE